MTPQSHARAIAIAPKFSALLSIFGSSFICYDVLTKKSTNTHSRLVLGMSICDIMGSITFFMSTWPIPDEDPIYGAVGNYHTCLIQGFFTQLSVSVPCYNAALTLYYLVYIRFGWSAQRIRLRVESFLHAVPLMIGITTAIMGLALNLYNDDKSKCWISPLPRTCKESWKNHGFTNCIRGNNASLYRLVFYYMFVWISVAMITVNMYLVYRAVLAHEKAFEQVPQKEQLGDENTNSNRQQQKADRHRQHSKQVAIQGYYFCAACYLTWIVPTTLRVVQAIQGTAPFALLMSHAMILPIQGFFNFLVYTVPKYRLKINQHVVTFKPTAAQTSGVFDDSSSKDDDDNHTAFR